MQVQQSKLSENSISEPFYFDSPEGKLFAIYHRPKENKPIHGQILFVPPFNEEMNRCRSMMTMQAKVFAAVGFGVLLVDLYGTGDSEGEYRDARWNIWLQNLLLAKSWLDVQPGGCRTICGVRLGAILAAELHAKVGSPNTALILWQPVIEGKLHFTQFLRIRIAAQIDRINNRKETTTTMREQLMANETVEVAGYEIHPELASSIDNAKLIDHQLAKGSNVLWLEHSMANKQDLSIASIKVLNLWPGESFIVNAQIFEGPAFWQLHERVLNPAIIDQTTDWLVTRINEK